MTVSNENTIDKKNAALAWQELGINLKRWAFTDFSRARATLEALALNVGPQRLKEGNRLF